VVPYYKVIVTPAAAPKLVSAKLADSLGSIDVLFDRATVGSSK